MEQPAAAKPITPDAPQTAENALRFDRVELAGAFGDAGHAAAHRRGHDF